jgi:hypothetical protein
MWAKTHYDMFNGMGHCGMCEGVGNYVVGWNDDKFFFLLRRKRGIHIPRCWYASGINFQHDNDGVFILSTSKDCMMYVYIPTLVTIYGGLGRRWPSPMLRFHIERFPALCTSLCYAHHYTPSATAFNTRYLNNHGSYWRNNCVSEIVRSINLQLR